MVRVLAGASHRLRWGCLSLAAVVAVLAITTDAADARRRKRSHARMASASSSYNPPYADIVIDARNGAVLHAANPDAPRHPASLTKVMTLYLLFERLEAGKIALDTSMPVSEEASSQAPTKLGLKPGETLKVEDAIKGLVTKSANDAAVVIAEALAGGSEDEFARMMTRKARALGMRGTTYRNANGLPNDEQVTTARDQALLGIAIQERFPKFYRYFSLRNFVYRGSSMRNHNHLLGEVEGVDGIKTGYIRDSGFNLVTSVKRGPRRIVAVVLGGRSASSRDAKMRGLIEETIARASTKTPEPVVAEAPKPEPVATAQSEVAAADSAPPPAPGSNAPITPLKVKTVTVRLVAPKAAAAGKPVEAKAMQRKPVETTHAIAFAAGEPLAEVASSEVSQPSVLGKLPAMIAAAKEAAVPSAKAEDSPAPVPARTPVSSPAAAHAAPTARHTTRGGWAIQVGAYEDEGEAKQHLSSAKSKVSHVFEKAEAYIERTVKGAKTYYRARFAGFDRNQAEATCKKLKREDVACMALKI